MSSNKTIAKNALFLYVRTIITTLVGIYTSRVVLQTLGVEDYGLYSVVGGVVGMLDFINASMNCTVSRFITYEMGRGDKDRLHKTMCSAMIVQLLVAAVVVLLVETIGVYFLYNKLVIPPERLSAAFWVLQISIVSAVLGITQVPYDACIVSHERFDLFSYLSIFSIFTKLAILYVVPLIHYDSLITYALFILLITLSTRLFSRYFCHRNFEESKFEWIFSKEMLKPMLQFSGWEVLGNVGRVASNTGTNMVFNMFYGVALNAAIGIGNTVSGAINGLAFNIVYAFQPNITKAYARKDMVAFEKSIIMAGACSFMMFGMFAMPFVLQMDYILNLWLVDVPRYTAEICIIHVLFNCLMMTNCVLTHTLKTIGKNMGQNICIGITGLSSVLLIYIFLTNKFDLIYSFAIMDMTIVMLLIYSVCLLYKYLPIPLMNRILWRAVCKVFLLFIGSFIFLALLSNVLQKSLLSLVLVSLVSVLLTCSQVYYFVLDKEQKMQFRSYLINKTGNIFNK